MTAVIQRVKQAQVSVEGNVVGSCEEGLMILLGVFKGDCEKDADLLAAKISKLRIFTDENDKLNLSVNDINGGALVISNFTLCANYSHGNRPDYISAEVPNRANELYLYFADKLRSLLVSGRLGTGAFGEYMVITPILDGPITIVMDSNVLKK
ncbi:MAG: D-tyrosyl-tRNA(Tyr) deacylase [Ruminococcaceae bacterium]|nr:D-tyrosyl-tRNA(Tyr) deacylase [Oscillospiraceae bacterium]